MSVPRDMEWLFPIVDGLVNTRNELRRAGLYAIADDFRDFVKSLEVGIYRVALDDTKDGGTWHWTSHE